MSIQRLTLFAVVVAAICCAVAITAFIAQSPARKSAPAGAAAKADEPLVAHHRLHPVRTIPIIGRTIPLEAQPPQPANIMQEQQLPPPKPDLIPILKLIDRCRPNRGARLT